MLSIRWMGRGAAACALALVTGVVSAAGPAGAPVPLSRDALGNTAPQRFVALEGTQEFSGELLVGVRDDLPRARRGQPMSRAEQAVDRLLHRVVDFAPEINEYTVRVPDGMNENTYADQLLETGDYTYVQPNWIVFTTGGENVPNDPDFGISWQHGAVESAKAWSIETGSEQAVVAIVDTGVDLDHPDLAGLLVPGYDSVGAIPQVDGGEVDDINGHGTFCAGCAAAEGDNATQVVGMGWNMRIMPIKATPGSSGSTALGNLTRGARWAAENGATVVNVSFSGVGGPAINATGNYVAEQGALLFWAAGNNGVRLGGFDHGNTVVVGASDINDNRAGFSNYGDPIDVFAPGAGVRATFVGGGQGTSSGTSFATPIAAGVAAMIWSVNPELRPRDLKAILEQSSDDIGAAGEDDVFGFGRVNLFNAVTMAQSFCPILVVESEQQFYSLCPGEPASFAVETDAVDATFQWFRDGDALPGEQTPSLDLASTVPGDTGVYSVKVATGCTETTLVMGEIEVEPFPTFTSEPADTTAFVGESVELTFETDLPGVPVALWTRDGEFAATTFGPTLTLTDVAEADAGEYVATIFSTCGTPADTQPATVSVVPDCAADINLDGEQNAADFSVWLDCFNGVLPGEACTRADVNADGVVGPSDFTAWLAEANSGCN